MNTKTNYYLNIAEIEKALEDQGLTWSSLLSDLSHIGRSIKDNLKHGLMPKRPLAREHVVNHISSKLNLDKNLIMLTQEEVFGSKSA